MLIRTGTEEDGRWPHSGHRLWHTVLCSDHHQVKVHLGPYPGVEIVSVLVRWSNSTHEQVLVDKEVHGQM